MNMLKWIAALSASMALVACGGGGGNAGSCPFSNCNGGGGAADLLLATSSAQIANTDSSTVTITVTAIDSNRNTLAGVPVTVTADSSGVVSSGTSTTDDTGKLVASLGIGGDRSNRVITVTATSGSVSKSTTVQVVGAKISSTLVPALIAPNTAGQVQYRIVDQSGTAMSDVPVQITAAGLTPAQQTGTTDSNGVFNFDYTSPSVAGNYPILASIGGASDSQTLQVQATSTVPPVSIPIASASVSASPNTVGVNLSGSATNRSELRALFLGANNLPIPNVRVLFDLAGDANTIGGTFTTGSQILYSDQNGVVTSAYVAGTRASPTDGVTVRACYGTTDTDPNLLNCTTSKTTTLTVTSEPLGVSIGTNETIVINDLTLVKKLVVSVADSAGVAKADVNLAVTLDLPNYRKGFYVVSGQQWVQVLSTICPNEDVNRNGVLESGEDLDQDNPPRLDPGKSDVIVSLLQNKTGADGTAELQIQYAKSFATWVDALITVSASGVSGTEGRATYLFQPVPADAAEINNIQASPAFVVSPYGQVGDCTNKN